MCAYVQVAVPSKLAPSKLRARTRGQRLTGARGHSNRCRSVRSSLVLVDENDPYNTSTTFACDRPCDHRVRLPSWACTRWTSHGSEVRGHFTGGGGRPQTLAATVAPPAMSAGVSGAARDAGKAMESHDYGHARSLIASAFGDVKRPVAAELFVGYTTDKRLDGAQSELSTTSWQELDVRRAPAESTLLRMPPRAFHYFLPAYMLACIEGRDRQGAAWITALSCLSPASGGELWRSEVFSPRSALFNAEQAAAVVAFLEHSCVSGELIPDDPNAPMVAEWSAAVKFWKEKLLDSQK
jgi:hypothetical protein